MDNNLVRKVKANMLLGALSTSRDKDSAYGVSREYGTVVAMQLLAARLPDRLMKLHVHWKDGDTYENICRKRLDLLNGLYPEW